jgi:hypothetical protein
MMSALFSVQVQTNANGSSGDGFDTWLPIPEATVASGQQQQGQLYTLVVNDIDPYASYSFRVVCNWLDFSKEKAGLPGTASQPVQPIYLYTSEYNRSIALLLVPI